MTGSTRIFHAKFLIMKNFKTEEFKGKVQGFIKILLEFKSLQTVGKGISPWRQCVIFFDKVSKLECAPPCICIDLFYVDKELLLV